MFAIIPKPVVAVSVRNMVGGQLGRCRRVQLKYMHLIQCKCVGLLFMRNKCVVNCCDVLFLNGSISVHIFIYFNIILNDFRVVFNNLCMQHTFFDSTVDFDSIFSKFVIKEVFIFSFTYLRR